MHHLDSWMKRDQLDVTCFLISLFNAQHVSDVNTSILRSFRLICWVISWVVLLWFDACWCYGVVWLGWCGIRMQAEALLVCSCGTCWTLNNEIKNKWHQVGLSLSNYVDIGLVYVEVSVSDSPFERKCYVIHCMVHHMCHSVLWTAWDSTKIESLKEPCFMVTEIAEDVCILRTSVCIKRIVPGNKLFR